jgi:hypothetical protein
MLAALTRPLVNISPGFYGIASAAAQRITSIKQRPASKEMLANLDLAELPEKPKRPSSSYINFHKAKFGEVKQSDRSLSTGDIAKRVASMWKELPPQERAKYGSSTLSGSNEYMEKIQRYNEVMKQTVTIEQLADILRKHVKANRKPRRESTTPRAKSAYNLYIAEQTTGGKNKLADVAKRWSSMSDNEKKTYQAKAAQQKSN